MRHRGARVRVAGPAGDWTLVRHPGEPPVDVERQAA
jgi:hypothetical protein